MTQLTPPNYPRRAVLKAGLLCLSAHAFGRALAEVASAEPVLKFGFLTDIHYGDKEPTTARFYRESTGKMAEAVAAFNQERPRFVVQLGDLIDNGSSPEEEISWLQVIEAEYAKTQAPRHYVLGNHCVATLTKEEFTGHTGAAKVSHYSFDEGGYHFVVLDACFRADGEPYGRQNAKWGDANIPAEQLMWLREDLAKTSLPVIVFAHQRHDPAGKSYTVKNAEAVREVFEKSGRVQCVLQGHSHKNDYSQINGIHYVTMVAMIEGSGLENSGYGFLEILPDHSLRIRGFRRQLNRELTVA